MTELRVPEVNITHYNWVHLSISVSLPPNILQLTAKMRFRHEHITSETHKIFAFDKVVNAVYFYSSVEILESVASSRGEFVYDKAE